MSPYEERLLAAIAARLEFLERARGLAAALDAAKRVRQIWLSAVDEDDLLANLDHAEFKP